jgi:nanoRNase/pAp phosphatase (c-di-AMP/oligoRNAs hydrolase)
MALVNLLQPEMRSVEEFSQEEFKRLVILDCLPGSDNAGCDNGSEEFSLIIDHHRAMPNGGFKGLWINLRNGSCCGTVFNLIQKCGFEFQDDNTVDSKVATALLVGIATDTDNLLADSCTEYEFEAYWKLFPYRDANVLKQIIRFKRPKFWVDTKAEAVKHAIIGDDGMAVVGIGLLPERHFNLIADMADSMIQWASVETAICFAVVDGETIVGSVRSVNSSVNVNDLCMVLGGKFGSGGGRDGKGQYRYSFQGLAIEEDEDEETKDEMWKTINNKEIKRIFKLMKK